MANVTRIYNGPIDAVETRTLDGKSHTVKRGESISLTPADAELFDLQPSIWSKPEAPTPPTKKERD